MNRRHFMRLGLLASLAFHECLRADIMVGPNRIVPSNEQSSSQSWTTIAGAGLLLCAVIAMLIVRIRKTRRDNSNKGTEGSRETGAR